MLSISKIIIMNCSPIHLRIRTSFGMRFVDPLGSESVASILAISLSLSLAIVCRDGPVCIPEKC